MMIMSTAPLVADAVATLLTQRPELHDQGSWMDAVTDPSGNVILTGCAAGHAAMLAGLVVWNDWDAAGEVGGLTWASDGAPAYCDSERWFLEGRRALGIGDELAHELFADDLSREAVIEALKDIRDAVPEDEIADRIVRTYGLLWTRPYTRH